MTRYADFYQRSLHDRDGFWREQAQLIDWHRPATQVCDASNPPFARWFVGGQTNLCHNAIDRHLKERADQPALIYVSTETGQEQTYTFAQLSDEVQRMAAILQGIAKRVEDGTASSAQAKASGAGARPMAELAWQYAQRA